MELKHNRVVSHRGEEKKLSEVQPVKTVMCFRIQGFFQDWRAGSVRRVFLLLKFYLIACFFLSKGRNPPFRVRITYSQVQSRSRRDVRRPKEGILGNRREAGQAPVITCMWTSNVCEGCIAQSGDRLVTGKLLAAERRCRVGGEVVSAACQVFWVDTGMKVGDGPRLGF